MYSVFIVLIATVSIRSKLGVSLNRLLDLKDTVPPIILPTQDTFVTLFLLLNNFQAKQAKHLLRLIKFDNC